MLQYYYCGQKFKIYLLEFLKQQLMENEKELEILRSLGEKNSSENYLEARIQFLRHQVTIQCSNNVNYKKYFRTCKKSNYNKTETSLIKTAKNESFLILNLVSEAPPIIRKGAWFATCNIRRNQERNINNVQEVQET